MRAPCFSTIRKAGGKHMPAQGAPVNQGAKRENFEDAQQAASGLAGDSGAGQSPRASSFPSWRFFRKHHHGRAGRSDERFWDKPPCSNREPSWALSQRSGALSSAITLCGSSCDNKRLLTNFSPRRTASTAGKSSCTASIFKMHPSAPLLKAALNTSAS